jgi:hypothetical protein
VLVKVCCRLTHPLLAPAAAAADDCCCCCLLLLPPMLPTSVLANYRCTEIKDEALVKVKE